MRGKKGISPLIATVLILGFTVALAAVIMVWGQRFVTNMQKTTEQTADTQLICANEVDLKIKDVCISGNDYKIVLENNGIRKVESVALRYFKSSSDVTSVTDNNGANGIASNAVYPATNAGGAPLGVGSYKLVESVPTIKINNVNVVCTANKQEYGSLDGNAITKTC